MVAGGPAQRARRGATTAFRDGRLIETGPAGDEVAWGEVLAWVPPRLLRMTWHPGYEAERASEVEVSFERRRRRPGGAGPTVARDAHRIFASVTP